MFRMANDVHIWGLEFRYQGGGRDRVLSNSETLRVSDGWHSCNLIDCRPAADRTWPDKQFSWYPLICYQHILAKKLEVKRESKISISFIFLTISWSSFDCWIQWDFRAIYVKTSIVSCANNKRHSLTKRLGIQTPRKSRFNSRYDWLGVSPSRRRRLKRMVALNGGAKTVCKQRFITTSIA